MSDDLRTANSSTTITTTGGDAIFSYLSGSEQVISGTGQYDSFLATQGSTNDGGDGKDGSAEGFNWDVANPGGPVLDEDNAKTSSLQLSTLKVVNVGGVDYYEFRLDLNEQPNDVQINALKVYLSGSAANPADFNPATDTFDNTSQTYTSVLNLDASTDRTLLLSDHTTGSGRDDYKLLIPVSAFPPSAGDYVTFYVNMGVPKEGRADPLAEDGGFDEWGAVTKPAETPQPGVAALQLTKTTTDMHNPAGLPAHDAGDILVDEAIKWTYTLANVGQVAVDNVVIHDDQGVQAYLSGDANHNGLHDGGENWTAGGDANNNGILDIGETWTFTATGTAEAGSYTNTAYASAHRSDLNQSVTSNEDTSTYFGADASIAVDKKTNTLDHGLNVFQGQSVTWTYAVKADGNVPLSNVTLTDDKVGNLYLAGDVNNNWIHDSGEDWTASGDANNDGILDLGETWNFKKTGTAALGNYTNTATAKGSYTDTAGHKAQAEGTDTSDYQGFSTRARSQGFWNNVADAWDNKDNNEANSTKSKVASGELLSKDVNPRSDGYLLLGDSNANGLCDDPHDLKISISLAKSILAGATGGDARLILLQQAIAAQLNINNGTPQPNNLIDEAVMWLTKKGAWAGNGFTVDSNNDGVVDEAGGKLQGSAVSTNGVAWKTPVDVFDDSLTISMATGEGLKNALEQFDLGKLVASGPGATDSVAYFNGTSFVGEQPNDVDNFWLTLHAVGNLGGIV